jgi:hypothetical protein
MKFWMRREKILPVFILLLVTAPLSWPAYSTCLQILNLLTCWAAHAVFRRYQWSRPNPTVVNSLMYMLSVYLQLTQVGRRIRLIEDSAKTLSLKKVTCKLTLRQLLICSRPPPLLDFFLGRASNFVGSESGLIQSVKVLKIEE